MFVMMLRLAYARSDPISEGQIGAIQLSHFETTVLVSILYLTRRMFMCNAVYEVVRPKQSWNQGQEGEQPESLESGQRHQN